MCYSTNFGVTSARTQYNHGHLLQQLQNVHVYLYTLTGPPCRTCGNATSFSITNSGNPNDNVGRPYYACAWCPIRDKKGWGTWADVRGVAWDNPVCYCPSLWPSRRDKAGVGSVRWAEVFFCCAVGNCSFRLVEWAG
ncbi:hypothetical protein C8A01DRAFT_18551 [Parachaetomium inaequale]|uniref:GRF-like zinc ribbon domain-containing protein n=1 Tax=Parachaetomium inaequale TaxID=2588326 RepID=A0AAN6PAD7_9PEZI|nr:hypothetical protein C8A01DRAFT_18551 [Parachaetomium inaequale]